MKSLVAVVAALVSAPALAQVPQQLAYEGRLATLDGGMPVNGTVSIEFAIWPTPDGGGVSPLWNDTLNPVVVVDGLYSVTLGTTPTAPLPSTLFRGAMRYLEVTVDNDILTPRQAIGSVPYSILSGGVQGGPVDATSYALNGAPFANSAGRTLLSYTDGGTSTKSVAGLFCGVSPTIYTGQIIHQASGAIGYRGTKLICEDTCKSLTAHMCNGQELVSSEEVGIPTPSGEAWYSAGVSASYAAGQVDDCLGWTYDGGSNSQLGDVWVGGQGPGINYCTTSVPIDCCN